MAVKQTRGVAIIALLLLAGLCMIGAIVSLNRESVQPKDRGPDELSAFIMCKDFVTRQLKAPKTAEFPPSTDSGVQITRLDNTQYNVIAYVDSQNSFGALVRTRYDCTVRYLGNDQWRLERLDTP